MSSSSIVSVPITYAYGLILIAGGATAYLLSSAKLFFINLWLRLTTGRPLDMLSGMDATLQCSSATYFTQPECPTVITVGMVFKGRLELAGLHQLYLSQVIKARDPVTGRLINPRWTQKVVTKFGFFAWERDERFDIRSHIKGLDEGFTDDATLVKLIERRTLTPLPKDRSPWEFLVTHKIAAPGVDDETAVIYRVHHSLADGMNLLLVCNALLDGSPDAKVKDSVKLKSGEKLANLAKRNPLLYFLANPDRKWSVGGVAEILWNLLAIALSAPWLVARVALQTPGRNSLHGPELSGRKLLAVSNGIQFQVLKDIASSSNCCINDVFHYGVLGALRRCNEEAPECPADEHAVLLVPLYMVRPNVSWTQNGFTFTYMSYPLRGESPRSHLKDIAAVTDSAKSSAEPLLNFAATQGLSNHLPAALTKRCMAVSYDYTAMATNIVGPSTDISILGLPITNMFFFPINHGRSGVSISMISLKGCVRLGVTVDRAVAPDDGVAKRLADHFENEVQMLHKVVMEQRPKP